MALAFIPSTQETEVICSVQGQPGLLREFQDNWGYPEKPCLKKEEEEATEKERKEREKTNPKRKIYEKVNKKNKHCCLFKNVK